MKTKPTITIELTLIEAVLIELTLKEVVKTKPGKNFLKQVDKIQFKINEQMRKVPTESLLEAMPKTNKI